MSHFLLPVTDQHSALEPILPGPEGEPRNKLHNIFIGSYISEPCHFAQNFGPKGKHIRNISNFLFSNFKFSLADSRLMPYILLGPVMVGVTLQ